ncbi:MAG: ATP-dependent zinc metalloprotease FtsH [Clostridia bacterium]|nr:ATP-dependent zinc metalloprotease FtsH [Clostridia bacterium]
MNKDLNLNKKSSFRGVLWLVILALLAFTAFSFFNKKEQPKEITYGEMVNYFNTEQVKSFELEGSELTCLLKDDTKVVHQLLDLGMFYQDVMPMVLEQQKAGIINNDYNFKEGFSMPWWVSWLPTLLMVGIAVLFFVMMTRQMNGGKAPGFARVRVKTGADQKEKKTFEDVAGADEEKAELVEIVDFLKAPRKYLELGARIPKGVLLVGPPGTGKTLLAKAVAGEAGVPFFSISGSDFVELYVGVGASRVRELFDEAKKNNPCIIFIDEIDAVGRRRGAGLGGGHDEREQTLNQLLVEMDGFGANAGIIVIAATNRADILDPALLRPGRFDRQVYVGYPDQDGREAILKVHAKGKKFEPDVSFADIAKGTIGFTGADIENLLNEAALLTARRNKTLIGQAEIEESIMKVVAGPEKKSRKVVEKERRLTAFHEAGHAVVSRFLETADPVHDISIVPRGRAGGYTLSLPQEDLSYATKNVMFEEIVSLLGGRVSEKLYLDDISTGASNDIQRATGIARQMVTKYGMSDKIGPILYGSENDEVFLGRDFATHRDYSEQIAARIDDEIKNIIDEAYAKAEQILSEHAEEVRITAELLLEKEHLTGKEFAAIFEPKAEESAEEPVAEAPVEEPAAAEVEETKSSAETDSAEEIEFPE